MFTKQAIFYTLIKKFMFTKLYLGAVYNYITERFLLNSGFLNLIRLYTSLCKFNILHKFLFQSNREYFSIVSPPNLPLLSSSCHVNYY